MRRKNMKKTATLFLLSVGINCMTVQDIVPVYEFDIDVQNVGAPIQSTMYGIFFEDINFGADGGLYAELIKNRSFEFENPWGGWEPFGDVSIAEKNPCFDKNSHYAHLTYAGQITGTGLENEGFKGIGIKANENYDFSLYARTETNNPIKLRIELVNRDNDIYETKTGRNIPLSCLPKRPRLNHAYASRWKRQVPWIWNISPFFRKRHSTIARTAYAAI